MSEQAKPGPRPFSSSWLKKVDESPLRYWWDLNHPQPYKQAFAVGSAVHCLVFEPDKYDSRFVTYAGKRDKRVKAYQEFLAEHDGKEILKPSEADECRQMADSVRSHQIAAGLLSVEGEAEKELTWVHERTQRPCRGRVDFVSPICLPDLKTAANIKPRLFFSDFIKFRYHMQMAFYVDGVKAAMGEEPPPYIIAVEKSPPFDVAVFEIPDSIIEAGRVKYNEAIDTLMTCEATDQWPGAYPDLMQIEMPAWAEAEIEDEITFGDEVIF